MQGCSLLPHKPLGQTFRQNRKAETGHLCVKIRGSRVVGFPLVSSDNQRLQRLQSRQQILPGLLPWGHVWRLKAASPKPRWVNSTAKTWHLTVARQDPGTPVSNWEGFVWICASLPLGASDGNLLSQKLQSGSMSRGRLALKL